MRLRRRSIGPSVAAEAPRPRDVRSLVVTHVDAAALHRLASQVGRHWLMILNLAVGLYAGLPWLAPFLMHHGWRSPGSAIYMLYASQCHQLPQRSYFLFGPKLTYELAQIQAGWRPTTDPAVLRQFVGNGVMGWKVAWSDRMVAMYGMIFLAGLIFALVRKRLRPLRVRAFVLLIMPLALDGGTHALSDLVGGIGAGFRETNAWLAFLTGNRLPPAFYVGDALGSFNSWVRLLTGTIFGIAVVWLAYPYLERCLSVRAPR